MLFQKDTIFGHHYLKGLKQGCDKEVLIAGHCKVKFEYPYGQFEYPNYGYQRLAFLFNYNSRINNWLYHLNRTFSLVDRYLC